MKRNRRIRPGLFAGLAMVMLFGLLPLADAQQPDAEQQVAIDLAEPFEGPWLDEYDYDLLGSGSFAATTPCGLQRGTTSSGAFNISLANPPRDNSVGTFTAALFFADFSDAPGFSNLDAEYVSALTDFTVEYFDHVSEGRVQVEIRPLIDWVRLSKPSFLYQIGPFSTVRSEYIEEVVALADPMFDFSGVDAVWIVSAPEAVFDGFSEESYGRPFVEADGQRIGRTVTLGNRRADVLMHEAMHDFGLPDLYDTSIQDRAERAVFVGAFDPLSDLPDGQAMELLTWQRWHLGWLEDNQIDCVSELPHTSTLTPLGVAGGTKAAVVKLDDSRVLVAELRAHVGYDDVAIPDYEDGFLVYTVDARIDSGSGPIRVINELTVDGDRNPDVLLQPGESLLAAGYLIEASMGPDGPQIQILDACMSSAVTIDMNTNGGDGTGTEGNDFIVGTPGNDIIRGLGGDDVICSGGGDDTINAGHGADVVWAGPGNDQVFGSTGDDVIDGGAGDDKLFGKQGDDTILGGPGNDVIHGNKGNDKLNGDAGDDRIFGYADDDHIVGGAGNDRLHGNFGADHIIGGPGDDIVLGYGDNDWLEGNEGNDRMNGNRDNDFMLGGFGDDVMWGADGNDQMWGANGEGPVDLDGLSHDNDTMNGNSGNDLISGGPGNDSLDGGIDTDRCLGNEGVDTATRCEEIFSVP